MHVNERNKLKNENSISGIEFSNVIKEEIKEIKIDEFDKKIEIIPLDIKILYSLPAFGKMSCLLLLRYYFFHINFILASKQ